MEIVKSYEILSQITGDFVGCADIIEGEWFAELWDESGDFSTYIDVGGLDGDALYKLIIDEFCANKGCSHGSVYLTDEEHSEILHAE